MSILWLIRKYISKLVASPESVMYLLLFLMATRRWSLPGSHAESTDDQRIFHKSYAHGLLFTLKLRDLGQRESRVGGGRSHASTNSSFIVVGVAIQT